MSRSLCLRCLSRSLYDVDRPLIQRTTTATFSTSTYLQKSPLVQKSSKGGKPTTARRQGGSLRLAKKTRVAGGGKPPAPGERKAIRKRIVLSNTNALAIRGLQTLNSSNSKATKLADLHGRFLAFDAPTIDALRALGAFKTSQSWHLFRTPATLVRADTVTIAERIEQASEKSVHLILDGEKSSGKSVLQLQAMAMAKAQGWILIHLPEAQELTTGTTSYQAVEEDEQVTYIQPHLTATLLENILNANRDILTTLKLSKTHQFPISIPDNISIARLLELGGRDPSISWSVWQALVEELTTTTQEGDGLQRPPVLFSIDNLAHIMKLSAYVDAEVKPIHAHKLALVNSFLNLLKGNTSLSNGGMVLACTSGSNKPATPTLDFVTASKHADNEKAARANRAPKRSDIAMRPAKVPRWDAYAKVDELVIEALKDVQLQRVKCLTKEEAKSTMEYYALSGIYRDSITDYLVAEKWSISGGGIIGELERSCIRQKY